MNTRFQLSLSCHLSQCLEAIAESEETTAEEVIRKAIWLYISAKDAKYDGLELGLVDSRTGALATRIVNTKSRHAR